MFYGYFIHKRFLFRTFQVRVNFHIYTFFPKEKHFQT